MDSLVDKFLGLFEQLSGYDDRSSCSISTSIVAPSFVMVTSPNPSTSILSMPLGPSEDRTDSAIIFAAMMFAFSASWPRLLEVPSLRIITCWPANSDDNFFLCPRVSPGERFRVQYKIYQALGVRNRK